MGREVLRRSLFDSVFDDGFVDFSRFSVEFAFWWTSRKVWFYYSNISISCTSPFCSIAVATKLWNEIRARFATRFCSEIGEKSIEIALRMCFSSEVGFQFDLGTIFCFILTSWWCFWMLLGASGRPWGLPWATLGGSRGALGGSWGSPGAPRDPLGTHLGPSWAPLGLPGSIWEGLGHQNHQKCADFGRSLHHFRCRNRWQIW